MRFFRLSLIFCLVFSILPSAALAEYGQDGPYTMEHTPSDLSVLFEDVQRKLSAEEYASVGMLLSNLKDHAQQLGYTNLPEYSWKLIERAELLTRAGKQTEAGFLVRQAVELSPTDSRVRLTASSFFYTI
ncbi:MAG: hypothetical protein KDD66_10940 [Bdellovibrionales bacterium]|nr:hypothetical protein [Bdellovibrionales bacterium]